MKIQELLNQSKPCWKYAAMDFDGIWYLYRVNPYPTHTGIWMQNLSTDEKEFYAQPVGYVFDIEPFDGDWKDSLIERKE